MNLLLPTRKKQALETMVQRAIAGSDIMDFLTWATLRRPYLSENVPFDLESHPYQVGIYRCDAAHIAVKKASQMGLSEWAISKSFYVCDELQQNVLYVMPTLTDISDFSQSRFDPALKGSPYLQSLVSSGGGHDGVERVMLKQVRLNFIALRGGQVTREGKASQLKSFPAGMVVRDELDEMNERVPEITRKRLDHSPLKWQLDLSTPTWAGNGIDGVWQESDQREWFVTCPHCGKWQYLKLDMCVTEFDALRRPVVWHGQAEGRAWLACRKCGKELDRLAAGVWVARYPGRAIAGFHPTKLHSPMVDPLSIVLGLQTTDGSKRKEIMNQDLGECEKPMGETITAAEIAACRREYAPGPLSEGVAYMGVDVGAVLHVVIRGERNGSGEYPQLYAGEVASFSDLPRLIERYHVRATVVDSEPETRAARQFQDGQRPRTVWLADYAPQGLDTPDPLRWDAKDKMVTMDRTRTLDEMYARFYAGKNTLPANYKAIPDYEKHLLALVRTQEKRGAAKTLVSVYVHTAADHYAHAENYCAAAMKARVGGFLQ